MIVESGKDIQSLGMSYKILYEEGMVWGTEEYPFEPYNQANLCLGLYNNNEPFIRKIIAYKIEGSYPLTFYVDKLKTWLLQYVHRFETAPKWSRKHIEYGVTFKKWRNHTYIVDINNAKT